MRYLTLLLVLAGFVLGLSGCGGGGASSSDEVMVGSREREDIADKDKWKLEDIYPNEGAWRKAFEGIDAKVAGLAEYKGTLGDDPAKLLGCLRLMSDISKEYTRLGCYAGMRSDEDKRDSKNLSLVQELDQKGTSIGAAAAFIEPELAAMDMAGIDKALAAKPGLGVYKMYLYDIQRTKKHTLSEGEEKILAQSSLISGTAGDVYSIFSNADLPYAEIKLNNGEEVRLDKSGYALYRASADRDERERVFQAFWKSIKAFERTYGTQLYGQVKKDMFYAQARGYESSLESALDRNNIPTGVYRSLIDNINANLDTFHRYLRLKARMLGIKDLKYSDLYAEAVAGVDMQFTIEEAGDIVVDAAKPLGSEYMGVVRKALDERWIDIYPTPGKRSGAYSNGGAYDVHPYILLNYNGQYDDMGTLAHELGHTMHSYFSNKVQPYPTADYSIFVAEVASTFYEALLLDKMLKETTNEDAKLSLLMNYLENARQTVFRQTQFAEFELRIHEKAERGESLTGENLTELYGDIVRKYYGHDKGVCEVEDLYTVEWAYIPHFYYNFYVYQYSTSFTASTALAEDVLKGDKAAVEKYLAFISAGSSQYPIDLLKVTGVDMTTSDPFDKTMANMNRIMDQIEEILDKRG